jgi:hypothetical protein
VEDQLPGRGGGVDALGEAAEADPSSLKITDRVDEVAEGASEPVQLPDDEGVAGSQLVQDASELDALVDGSAGVVDEESVTPRRPEGVELEVGVLVESGDRA